ncbi:hypothetical protein [Umezawaea sp. NPDC059074]|uniref:hypothetical protein n=1 Tax=Umezawaea sp. NPDC059074 TaxID=3346716 RepID=UPI00368308E7
MTTVGLDSDRKQLAAKRKEHDEVKGKADELRRKAQEKHEEARKASADVQKFQKEAKVLDRKVAARAADIGRLQGRISRTEVAEAKRAAR